MTILIITSWDVILESLDEVGLSCDGYEGVSDVFALQQSLEDLDGADRVDVDVGDHQNAIVHQQQVEKLLSQVSHEHRSMYESNLCSTF